MKRIIALLCVIVSLFSICACAPLPPEKTEASSQPQTPVLERLEAAKMPDKTKYLIGEDFDPTGLIVNGILSDGSVLENVDWTMDDDIFLTSATTGVNVYYGGKTLQIPIQVRHAGNVEEYAVDNFPVQEDSPLKGMTFFWLGSSVTLGASANNESMADFIAKKHGCCCIKEAVSGTTLATYKENSYVQRLNGYLASADCPERMDAVIVQLSTNDQSKPENFGVVTAADVRNPESFDTATTFGAIEYIIATVKQTWDCPIFFYVNPPTGQMSYMTMVMKLYEIAAKWDIGVIDMFMDQEFNNIPSAQQRKLWMADKIHPTKAGYRDWWLPKFEEALLPLG